MEVTQVKTDQSGIVRTEGITFELSGTHLANETNNISIILNEWFSGKGMKLSARISIFHGFQDQLYAKFDLPMIFSPLLFHCTEMVNEENESISFRENTPGNKIIIDDRARIFKTEKR